MLTVAGGIILAVLFFVFLPQSIVVASVLFALVLTVGGAALAVVLVGPWETVGIVAILAGFALLVWYRIMAVSNRQIDDDFRLRYPYPAAWTGYMPRAERSEGARGHKNLTKILRGLSGSRRQREFWGWPPDP